MLRIKSRIIYKTMVAFERELPWVVLQLLELLPVVDLFIICEANFTSTGLPKNYNFEKLISTNPIFSNPKIKYLKIDMTDKNLDGTNSPENSHSNERLQRNAFTQLLEINPNDIVISSDADEIIYRKSAKKFIKILNSGLSPFKSYCLNMHTFIFKVNQLWENKQWHAATISKASYFLKQESPEWRYLGRKTRLKHGCHFSWIMDTEQILSKLISYSHGAENIHLRDKLHWENSLKNKTNPFNSTQPFEIRTIKLSSRIMPKNLYQVLGLLSEDLYD